MSRIEYAEDEEYPGQFALWHGNVNRSLLGKKGQAALKELHEALLALPEKRLIDDDLVRPDGEVCAIGAVCLKRTPEADRARWIAEQSKWDHDLRDDGPKTGFPRLVLWAVVTENDIEAPREPEARYAYMLAWVEARLRGESIVIW